MKHTKPKRKGKVLPGVGSSGLLAAVKRLVAANEALGAISENRVTYYEESPTKNAECHKRWVELNGALAQAREAANDQADRQVSL